MNRKKLTQILVSAALVTSGFAVANGAFASDYSQLCCMGQLANRVSHGTGPLKQFVYTNASSASSAYCDYGCGANLAASDWAWDCMGAGGYNPQGGFGCIATDWTHDGNSAVGNNCNGGLVSTLAELVQGCP